MQKWTIHTAFDGNINEQRRKKIFRDLGDNKKGRRKQKQEQGERAFKPVPVNQAEDHQDSPLTPPN
jgi:hypothetical protein